jgi:hypothetical protein
MRARNVALIFCSVSLGSRKIQTYLLVSVTSRRDPIANFANLAANSVIGVGNWHIFGRVICLV